MWLVCFTSRQADSFLFMFNSCCKSQRHARMRRSRSFNWKLTFSWSLKLFNKGLK